MFYSLPLPFEEKVKMTIRLVEPRLEKRNREGQLMPVVNFSRLVQLIIVRTLYFSVLIST